MFFLVNFVCILLKSNHRTFLVQFGINCTREFFNKLNNYFEKPMKLNLKSLKDLRTFFLVLYL